MFEKLKELFKKKNSDSSEIVMHDEVKADSKVSNTPVYDRRNDFLSAYEMERCLLQQTTWYRRGTPIVAGTNKDNELFLIAYSPKMFDIVKVEYDEKNHLKLVYDYRKNNVLYEELKYSIDNQCLLAELRLTKDKVSFMIFAKMDCRPWGLSAYLDQKPLYDRISGYFSTYQESIATMVALHYKKNDYSDLLQYTKKISDDDKKKIFELVNDGNNLEAIKLVRELTGLGLADAKKIGENPYMYL